MATRRRGRAIEPVFERGDEKGNDGRDVTLRCRKLLAILEGRMDRTGQKFGVWKRLLSDGTEVKLTIMKNGLSTPIRRAHVVSKKPPLTLTVVPGMFMESGMCHIVSFNEELFASDVYMTDNIRSSYSAALFPTYQTWLDWHAEYQGELGNVTRVNSDHIPSLAITNRTEYDRANEWEACPIAKLGLAWQAYLGQSDTLLKDYEGLTKPSV